MIHNASVEKYRTPVGAVTCGSEMMIRLYDVGQEVNKAEIIMYSESFHREYEMKRKKDCMEEHIKMTSEAGVVWYYFRIWEHGKCYFYGARHGKTQGEGMIVDDNPDSFQITVYEEDFNTPRWMSKGIMYQIFPDRFCQGNKENMKRGKAYHESMGRTVYLHDDWEEQPVFGPLPGKEFYDPCDYFGGDIEGIISKLDDLKRLGISCIYLNPIGNITGAWRAAYEDNDVGTATTASGAVYATFDRGWGSQEISSVGSGGSIGRFFDASRSNPIYGRSGTVQPPALVLLPCIHI